MSKLQQRAEAAAEERAKAPTVTQELDRYQGNIAAALPPGFPGGVQRFARIVRTAVSANPQLAGCTPRSIVGAAIQAAQLGLTPNLMGQCWILPYRDNKKGVIQAQFQLGWKGLVELAGRAGIHIDANTVHEHDDFSFSYGLKPELVHRPALGDNRGRSILWYAVAHFTDGAPSKFAVVDRAHVDKRRAASKSPNSPAWTDWYDEMAIGKAVRELCRTLVLSVELATALHVDDQVIDVAQVVDLTSDDNDTEADDDRGDVIEATIAGPTTPAAATPATPAA